MKCCCWRQIAVADTRVTEPMGERWTSDERAEIDLEQPRDRTTRCSSGRATVIPAERSKVLPASVRLNVSRISAGEPSARGKAGAQRVRRVLVRQPSTMRSALHHTRDRTRFQAARNNTRAMHGGKYGAAAGELRQPLR